MKSQTSIFGIREVPRSKGNMSIPSEATSAGDPTDRYSVVDWGTAWSAGFDLNALEDSEWLYAAMKREERLLRRRRDPVALDLGGGWQYGRREARRDNVVYGFVYEMYGANGE
ncbi:hypothetical protein ISF_00249 [Cordyceps fumosorosea ARSEF 2679]|uniref:Uncharacterized protein n=1 Tax=Cordyceps fumosorosea (strain ARSEF 2679) TaxID=1081104 RepID=A0A168E418_CORFA|nr:hypothetical protein ISF_00249 [Cordyceps fumosorosea ARSEF 2679]OAA73348.1 hypothetical protein ISF_00249 [Cordyceps fumosorosea ARSEF 2679]